MCTVEVLQATPPPPLEGALLTFLIVVSLWVQSTMTGKKWQQEPGGGVGRTGPTAFSRASERDECCCSAHFLLCIRSGTLAHKIMPLTFRVSYPSRRSLTDRQVCLLGDSKPCQVDNISHQGCLPLVTAVSFRAILYSQLPVSHCCPWDSCTWDL